MLMLGCESTLTGDKHTLTERRNRRLLLSLQLQVKGSLSGILMLLVRFVDYFRLKKIVTADILIPVIKSPGVMNGK